MALDVPKRNGSIIEISVQTEYGPPLNLGATNNSGMQGFRDRLRTAISRSRYNANIQALSISAGMGKSTLYNIINNDNLDRSTQGPGFFAIARAAALGGFSLDYLAGTGPWRDLETAETPNPSNNAALRAHAEAALTAQDLFGRSRPTVDGLQRLHAKSGGRIEAFTPYLDYCDLYLAPTPEEANIRVHRVGKLSLAAVTMGEPSVETLQTALDRVDDAPLRAQWVKDYAFAAQRGTLGSIEELDHKMDNRPIKVKMQYLRLLLRLENAEGDVVILNYSSLVV